MDQENPHRLSEHDKLDSPYIKEVAVSTRREFYIPPEQSLCLDLVQYSKLLQIRQFLSRFLLIVVTLWLYSNVFLDFGDPFNLYPSRLLLAIFAGILAVSMFGTYLYRLEEQKEKGY